jgi:mRNA interferase MazF
MSSASFPQNGEVWYVGLPNQPHDRHQPRTAIIVSTDGRNKACNDVIVVPTTSSESLQRHPLLHVSIPKGEGGLPKNSIARCDQVTTLDKEFLVKGPLGSPINLKYRWQIIEAVRVALGDTRV